MNRVLIVDTSESDCRLMSGLLTRAGYEPTAVDTMEAAKYIDMIILFCHTTFFWGHSGVALIKNNCRL